MGSVGGRHAEAWRTHAEQLREQAAETDPDETVTIRIAVYKVTGETSVEPELRWRRDVLAEQAQAATATADQLEAYATGGHDSATVENMVGRRCGAPGLLDRVFADLLGGVAWSTRVGLRRPTPRVPVPGRVLVQARGRGAGLVPARGLSVTDNARPGTV